MKLSPRSTIGLLAILLTACVQATPNEGAVGAESSSSSSSASSVTTHGASSSKTAIVKTHAASSTASMKPYADYTDADWKKILTPDQYAILREAGTETPFTSDLLHEKRTGTYVTADCNVPVFRSEQKYDSGTGWPSFWAPISPDVLQYRTDASLGDVRTEVLSPCGGHLGHVFDDGPAPTGKRYCMNGLALKFIPDPGQ